LEKLGFPWILSSESRLINGLRGIFVGRNFARPFALGGGAGTADAAVEGHADAQNYSSGEPSVISAFHQSVIAR
jgi:hypothetical protein